MLAIFSSTCWYLLALLVLMLPGFATAKDPTPAPVNLAVHEWGVFRVSEDADFANAAVRAEWDDLPSFAYGHIRGRAVPQHWGALEDRAKPITFFYADAPTQAQVQVSFPGGMAGAWFPATMNPAVEGLDKQPKVGGSLHWVVALKQPPNGWRPRLPAVPEVPATHWVSRVRQVKADEVFARFGPNGNDVEREKFIYYDGLFPQKRWLKIVVDKDRVGLTSQVKHPVFDITVVDRRGDKVRVGRVGQLDAGGAIKEIKFVDADPARFTAAAAEALVKQLVGAGLFEDEAKSLADIWRARLLETPGLSLFYRLPQAEYDALMPLTITPQPKSVVRTALIYHSHLEPDFADRVLDLVRQLDEPRFAERDAALKKLLAIGPAALVQLQRLQRRADLSVEVRDRIAALVKKWSAKDAFEP
jgi:hypothetical protein